MGRPSLRDVIEKHRKSLMAIEGVVGVGAGTTPDEPKETCVLVYVTGDTSELPRELEGYRVEVEKTRPFHAK